MKNIFWSILTMLFFNLSMHGQSALYVNGDIIQPGFQVEYNFNKKHAVNLNSYYYPYIFSRGDDWIFRNTIRTNIQYCYYYNEQKRLDRGLNTSNNANNYFMFAYNRINFLADKNFVAHGANSFNLGWGMKRFIRKSNWYYGAEVGISIPFAYDIPRPMVLPYFKFKFGYMLYKRDFNKSEK